MGFLCCFYVLETNWWWVDLCTLLPWWVHFLLSVVMFLSIWPHHSSCFLILTNSVSMVTKTCQSTYSVVKKKHALKVISASTANVTDQDVIQSSRKLSKEITFMIEFHCFVTICERFYPQNLGGVVSFGMARASNLWKFSSQKLYFSPIRESFSPSQVSHYMVI